MVNLELLRGDWRERSTLGVKELVELLSVFLLEKSSERPSHAVDEEFLEAWLVDLSSSSLNLVQNSGQEVDLVVDSAKFWARHDKVVVLVKLLIGSWVLDEFISALSHPKLLIWVAVGFELNSIEQPSLNQWSPEEIGG